MSITSTNKINVSSGIFIIWIIYYPDALLLIFYFIKDTWVIYCLVYFMVNSKV